MSLSVVVSDSVFSEESIDQYQLGSVYVRPRETHVFVPFFILSDIQDEGRAPPVVKSEFFIT